MADVEDVSITDGEWAATVRVLQRLSEDPGIIQHDERVKALIAKIHRNGKKGERKSGRIEQRVADRATLQATAMVRRDRESLPVAEAEAAATDADDDGPTVGRAVPCYVCKAPFTRVHFFYHQLCPECAAQSYAKRDQRADLRGRTALITGGRIKIGYRTTLRMLRDGARVIVTTRFPANAARRFSCETDFGEWRDRLDLHGLDLRDLAAVQGFCDHLLAAESSLDILINNAAQTVSRPLAFYRHLLAEESKGLEGIPGAGLALIRCGRRGDAPASALPLLLEARPGYRQSALESAEAAIAPFFPPGELDADGQQADRRPANSWSLRLGQVGTLEALEVHLVNAIAPFVLCGQLRPLLARSPFDRRFIVNVSAMEGQFARGRKTTRHPHTNMAKAALNMLTRTSAADYACDGIYMNSVDTGWVTDENPYPKHVRLRDELAFHAPLDAIDGAARVYDPIARGINEPGRPLFGHFLKNYAPYAW